MPPVLSCVAVIPARWASSRLPGKPLADLAGVPMVLRVLAQAEAAHRIQRALVATDDPRIAAVVAAAGGEVVMTDPTLASGSDRVAAAWTGWACIPTWCSIFRATCRWCRPAISTP